MASPTYSSNIAGGAFLPTQGMSFSGAGNVRVYDWKTFRALKGGAQHPVSTQLPARTPAALAEDAAAIAAPTQTMSKAASAATSSGGLLRPGAIDQSQFKAMLAAASVGAPSAMGGPSMPGTGRSPLAPMPAQMLAQMPVQATGQMPALAPATALAAQQAAPANDGIPTLTAAQFAALTGGPSDAGPGPAAATAAQAAVQAAAQPAADPTIPPDALTMTDAAIPPDEPGGTVAPAGNSQTADAAVRKKPKQIHGTKDENGVLLVTHIDRDTRREYAAKGIKWKLVDDPEADRLFFGPDGKPGWHDLVDLINPLQHIPLVNVIYRRLTGDNINGAAELLGAIPFGPLSTLSAIANLAVRDASGRDIGSNVIAMITGEDGKSGDSTKDLAARDATPDADPSQVSAALDPAALQGASLPAIQERLHGR